MPRKRTTKYTAVKVGAVYGRLTVVAPTSPVVLSNNKNYTAWLCLCSCGTEKVLRDIYLKTGTQSCGCLHKERAAETLKIKCVRSPR